MKLLGKTTIRRIPAQVTKDIKGLLREFTVHELVPQIGIIITRPAHEKARSIKNYYQLTDQRRQSIKRKYDGEYYQVHVDLNKGRDCIKIFSKSGKDSTNDRIDLHRALRDSLRLENIDYKIKN